jgi:cytochrome c553
MNNCEDQAQYSERRRTAMRNIIVWAISLAIAGDCIDATTVAAAESPSSVSADFFEARIRPLLLARCIECHGAKKQESGLRLDSRENLVKGNDEGPVVLLKKPEKSRLLRAVRGEGDIKMPPDGKLTADEIAALAEWIKLGLPWPVSQTPSGVLDPAEAIAAKTKQHWAFQPVPPRGRVSPRLANRVSERRDHVLQHEPWVQSPIDRFILAQLEAAGILPSPPADRRTLIRRAYFDLIGLPPTYEEITEFELDNSPDAFAKVVDQLLASPHYGERWGRYWLDLARYSDTKGYIFNEDRNFPHAYNYRDWVVRALNEDLPYDQFLVQQIAADCLSAGRPEQDSALAAMGFLTLGRRFLGIKPDIIDDRIDVVFRSTMALTVSCARCHDHKFDPIPTADYYSLYGVFDAAVEKQVPIEKMTPEFEKELREHERQVAQALSEGHAKVAADLRDKAASYLLAAYDANQRGAPRTDDYDFVPYFGDINPFFVNRWRTYLDETAERFDPVMAPFHAFGALRADEFAAAASELAPRFAANDDADPRRRINPLVAKLFDAEPPKSLAEVAERYANLLNEVSAEWERLLISHEKSGVARPTELADGDREQLRLVFYGPFAPTNVPTRDVELLLDQKTKDKVAELKRKLAAYAAGPGAPRQAMILEEVEMAHNPRIFVRGNASRPGGEVPRQFLSAVTPDRKPFEQQSGRLEMAQAIASKDNPLTARVFVNRVWAGHFGAPLVRTASDFGLRSEPPSHPELLDYLARTFMDGGWSIKRLHRQIILSSTYQQSSDPRPDGAARDPENRLLWRMNRRRLDWEATRDALFAATGDLDRTLGGPAVEITMRPFSHRRTVYARIERQNLPGLFRAFDFASPDAHAPQRFTTTVPQQALFLLNGPFVIERAEALASRNELSDLEDSAERVRKLYEVIFGRKPTTKELSLGLQFVAQPETTPPPLSATALLAEAWQYGYGAYDEASQRMQGFTPFTHFTGSAWQAGPALPDPQAGWAMLSAEGGHPGNDPAHAAIRRWVAPRDGTVKIEGALTVRMDASKDGVRGRIVSSRAGRVSEWIAEPKQKAQKTTAEGLAVKAGDMIDFVVDLRDNIENDTFIWTAVVQLDSADGDTTRWDSAATFREPRPRPLNIWARYAQVLLLSNEFVFVD